MNNKAGFVLLFSLVLSSLYASQAAPPGGWNRIDVKDPHVIEIGKFAVSFYDKVNKLGLTFVEVVMGDSQVVSDGINYKLTVTVNVGVGIAGNGESRNYEAIVFEKQGLGSLDLMSFTHAN